ncbi:MAG: hypothetical protein HRU07_09855 [Nitrosopumilus sp.]|nr:hypothetical protein [Nitrosopumilus sp.]NRA06431.1 hypothetical protein [Nitrosopumilus sp.]
MTEERLDTHMCVVDNEDGNEKRRIRIWDKNTDTSGNCRITLKLTKEERLKLIHMLSE